MKAKWMEVKQDVSAYVDSEGEVIAKIHQNYDYTWRYKDKEFIDRWSAQKYVEKVKKYDDSGLGRTDHGSGHAGNGQLGAKDGDVPKDNKKRGRELFDGDFGRLWSSNEVGDEGQGV